MDYWLCTRTAKTHAYDLEFKKRLKLKHSIGASLKGDKYLIIVPKGSIIPFSNSEIVQTSEDNQVTSYSSIYYGENPIAGKNYKIGVLKVYGLPPKTVGESKLKFIASIDLSGYYKLEKISLDTGAKDYWHKVLDLF
jgi:molecular chaperone DnaK (HSP70)